MQYRTWCLYSLGCTAGRTRRTGPRPPCRLRPPGPRPGWCSRQWSPAWASRRACSCQAPPGAGPAPWTRCQGWSRPRPTSGSVWWPRLRNEPTWNCVIEGTVWDCVENSLVISPALEMYRAKKKEDPRVGWVLPPKLHRMFLCIFIITGLENVCWFVDSPILFILLYLVLGVGQLRQTSRDRDLMLVVSHHVQASLYLRRTFSRCLTSQSFCIFCKKCTLGVSSGVRVLSDKDWRAGPGPPLRWSWPSLGSEMCPPSQPGSTHSNEDWS